MLAVAELAPHVGLRSACQAFALNRGFVYRDRAGHRVTASRHVPRARPRPPLALSIAEQDLLLGLLDSERFTDVAPAAVFATLLDEGRYHGSIRTMYRLLAAHNQTGERRRQRTHPLYAKPELLAIRPNEVFSRLARGGHGTAESAQGHHVTSHEDARQPHLDDWQRWLKFG